MKLGEGGTYKKMGRVVIHLDITHSDILDFVQVRRQELPWVKRCIDLTPDQWTNTESGTKEAILRGIAKGDIWLNKIKHDENGKRIFSNVCLEGYLPSRGTCFLQHLKPCLPVISATYDQVSVKVCPRLCELTW